MKFLQHGPAFLTAGWRNENGRRNIIESRNTMLKMAFTKVPVTMLRALGAVGRQKCCARLLSMVR